MPTRRHGPGRILLAEDDEEMRRLIAQGMRKDGHAVVEVKNGAELLDYVGSALLEGEDDGVDVIVSDIRMPGFTGMEVLNGMRGARCRTPMVLITAFGDAATHYAARALGAVALLDKPFEIDELRSVVRRVLCGSLRASLPSSDEELDTWELGGEG